PAGATVDVDPRVDGAVEHGRALPQLQHVDVAPVHHRREDVARDGVHGVHTAVPVEVHPRTHTRSSRPSSPRSRSLSRNASGVNGLMTYSCAPAASARTI